MTLSEWFSKVYPLFVSRIMTKCEHTLEDGTTVKAYWVVNIIRIDITPKV